MTATLPVPKNPVTALRLGENSVIMAIVVTRTAKLEWKTGTGSEPRKMPDLWKNAAGSVPVPFFHVVRRGRTLQEPRKMPNL